MAVWAGPPLSQQSRCGWTFGSCAAVTTGVSDSLGRNMCRRGLVHSAADLCCIFGWCIKACLLGSPPRSQQLAQAYMDGGGNAVALHLLWAAGATSCFTGRKLWEPAKAANVCGPPPALGTASPFHQWAVPFVAAAAGESLLLPHCLVSQSCDWKLH